MKEQELPKTGTFQTSIASQARDLTMLAGLSIPDICTSPFPSMFVYFWNKARHYLALTKGTGRLGLGIPRGFAKTTFLKLLVLYIILFTDRKFILIFASKQDLADKILADIILALSHPNIVKLFGVWDSDKQYDRAHEKKFYFRNRTIVLVGMGTGGSSRGIAESYSRPDVIIFDDAQTQENAKSPTLSKEFQDWFYGTACMTKDPKRCFILYVGNIYKKVIIEEVKDQYTGESHNIYGCLLRNLKESPDWETLIVGAIRKDGTSLWEELQSLEDLLAEYSIAKRANKGGIFLAEKMNDDEAIDHDLFDLDLIPEYPFLDRATSTGSCIIIDPSLGKKKSDTQMLGLVELIDDYPVLRELRPLRLSNPDLVMEVLDWATASNIPLIVVENYAYQESLAQWFDFFIEKYNYKVRVECINHGTTSKNYEIVAALKALTAEEPTFYVHPDPLGIIIDQATRFDPKTNKNEDDGLDILAYTPKVVMAFRSLMYNYWGQVFKGTHEYSKVTVAN